MHEVGGRAALSFEDEAHARIRLRREQGSIGKRISVDYDDHQADFIVLFRERIHLMEEGLSVYAPLS
jgi:hypothetical protein